jgi:hypothetical protein
MAVGLARAASRLEASAQGSGAGVYSSSRPPRVARGSDEGAVMDAAVWYVLLTSASGNTVFATLGPYITREVADAKARQSRAVHYRVVESALNPTPFHGRG